jgi:hypothetical protein
VNPGGHVNAVILNTAFVQAWFDHQDVCAQCSFSSGVLCEEGQRLHSAAGSPGTAVVATGNSALSDHLLKCRNCRLGRLCKTGAELYAADTRPPASPSTPLAEVAVTVKGLEPMPDPQEALEREIASEVKAATKRVLELAISGLDRAPARTLRLVEQYAKNQRDTLAALAIDDEPDKARPFADGAGGMTGVLREMMEIYRSAMVDVAKPLRALVPVVPQAPTIDGDTVLSDDGGDTLVVRDSLDEDGPFPDYEDA